jgi:hypothetical protein
MVVGGRGGLLEARPLPPAPRPAPAVLAPRRCGRAAPPTEGAGVPQGCAHLLRGEAAAVHTVVAKRGLHAGRRALRRREHSPGSGRRPPRLHKAPTRQCAPPAALVARCWLAAAAHPSAAQPLAGRPAAARPVARPRCSSIGGSRSRSRPAPTPTVMTKGRPPGLRPMDMLVGRFRIRPTEPAALCSTRKMALCGVAQQGRGAAGAGVAALAGRLRRNSCIRPADANCASLAPDKCSAPARGAARRAAPSLPPPSPLAPGKQHLAPQRSLAGRPAHPAACPRRRQAPPAPAGRSSAAHLPVLVAAQHPAGAGRGQQHAALLRAGRGVRPYALRRQRWVLHLEQPQVLLGHLPGCRGGPCRGERGAVRGPCAIALD